jgi:hypothetical protein
VTIGIEPAKVDSRRVYAIAREVVGPLAKDLGFKRGNSMLSWTRPQGSEHLTFWFQVSQFGWSRYTGSQFTVEFQLWTRPEVGASLQRARLPELLNAREREEVRQRQNLVIGRLVRPPQSYIEWLGSASIDVESLLSRQFEQVDRMRKERTSGFVTRERTTSASGAHLLRHSCHRPSRNFLRASPVTRQFVIPHRLA